ncbi:MAG: hypothetical protein ACI4GW_09150 [Lachnospiraceae bacterium]
MIIMPPEEIRKYISVDENGQWIHDPKMPNELKKQFEDFVKNVEEAKKFNSKVIKKA